MFGRKQRRIEFLEELTKIHVQEINSNIKKISELREQLERKHDIHNAFAMVQDHLLKLSEELRQDGSKIVYREKHKNSEGNIFVSEKKYDAVQIDNITRALYEIEKSERKGE